MREPQDTGGRVNPFRFLTFGMELGLIMALPLVGGILAGRWLDDRFGTGSVFTLILVPAGLLYGGFGFFRLLLKGLDE